MIDRQQAETIAEAYIRELVRMGSPLYVLRRQETLDEAFGWVFFYQSARYLETGAFSDQLAGNSPLVVFRDSGEVRSTGTAYPLDHYLAPIREEWASRQR